MERIFLIKYGEISLKGENQEHFIHILKLNIKRRLKGVRTLLIHKPGRFYLDFDQADKAQVAHVLAHTFGIIGFTEAYKTEKDPDAIAAAAREIIEEMRRTAAGSCFKVDCRRTDKKFPLDSYQLACRLGDIALGMNPELKVNLYHPDWVLNVEIREAAYLYGKLQQGIAGLPTGCAGRGLLLLSGGIDSPVAGYLMGKRGLNLDAIYFHTYPFTSDQSAEKVKQLAGLLSGYFKQLRLFIVPFTAIQTRINEQAQKNEVTLHARACMMSIADKVAKRNQLVCLVTGESLSQVASQTPQSIRFTGSLTDLPVFRPLIGMDKIEIIDIARRIGTYETSILPYPDCCTLFAPPHPLIKPNYERIQAAYRELEMEPLLAEAAEKAEYVLV
jgi:thiamine biosynthesis protein ThiI